MKRKLIASAILMALLCPVWAQNPAQTANKTVEKTAVEQTATTAEATTADNAATLMQGAEYTLASYENLKFELPTGMPETRENGYMAKMADGSFGISIIRSDNKAINEKRALSLVKDLSRSMHLEGARVAPVKVGGMDGAKATGKIENKNVTVMILTSWGKVYQIVSIYNPEHSAANDHFFNSLKK